MSATSVTQVTEGVYLSGTSEQTSIYWLPIYDFYAPFIRLLDGVKQTQTQPGYSHWIIPTYNVAGFIRFCNRLITLQTMDETTFRTKTFTFDPKDDEIFKEEGKRDPQYALRHGYSEEEMLLLAALVFDLPKKRDSLQTIIDDEKYETPFLGVLNKYIRGRDKDVRRGDICCIFPQGYRNDGVFIFDTTELLPLAYEPDDYGTVPSTFPVITEFPIAYWTLAVTHNLYVWVDTKALTVVNEIPLMAKDFQYEMGEEVRSIALIVAEYKGRQYNFVAGLMNDDGSDAPVQRFNDFAQIRAIFDQGGYFEAQEMDGQPVLAIPPQSIDEHGMIVDPEKPHHERRP